MRIQQFDTKADWVNAMVAHTKRIFEPCCNDVFIALTGGKTPRPLYEALRTLNLSCVHLYVADERFVPNEHLESNSGMISEALIKNNDIKSFHAFDTSISIDETIKKYAEELKEVPDGEFDIIFLGIGPDGHILSLFPHTAALEIDVPTVVHATTEVFAVRDRMTMTLSYVVRAKHIILFAAGEEKLRIIETLAKGQVSIDELPIMAIKDHPEISIFYLK